MSGESSATPATLETRGPALVARPPVTTLDEADFKTLIGQVDDACAADRGIRLIVVDLSSVATLPSLTIGLLVHLANKCRAREQKLTFAGLQPQIRQVFTITKMDRIFRLADSVEAATA